MTKVYNVTGKPMNATGTKQIARGLSHKNAVALMEHESRPRMIRKGKIYERVYDWQWLAVCRDRI